MDGLRPVSGTGEGIAIAPGREPRADLKKAVADFESLFINQMLKTMRETVKKGDLFNGGSGEELYTTLLDAELSRSMAQAGGIGLGDILLSDFTRGEHLPPDNGLSPGPYPLEGRESRKP